MVELSAAELPASSGQNIFNTPKRRIMRKVLEHSGLAPCVTSAIRRP